MDKIQLGKLLAKLRSFADNLPNGDIEEKYVTIYHNLLSGFEDQLGHDLAEFRIPSAEVARRSAGGATNDYGEWENYLTDEAFCDREIFLINLNGAVNFIASLLKGPGKPPIGF